MSGTENAARGCSRRRVSGTSRQRAASAERKPVTRETPDERRARGKRQRVRSREPKGGAARERKRTRAHERTEPQPCGNESVTGRLSVRAGNEKAMEASARENARRQAGTESCGGETAAGTARTKCRADPDALCVHKLRGDQQASCARCGERERTRDEQRTLRYERDPRRTKTSERDAAGAQKMANTATAMRVAARNAGERHVRNTAVRRRYITRYRGDGG